MEAGAPPSLGDPVYARVRERLRGDILSGIFEANARLKIAQLSKRYAVSQMPIREALQQLQGEGLIVIEPNKGARVRTVDERFIRNTYGIREAIDALLVRSSVPHLTQEQLDELRAVQYDFEGAARENDVERCVAIDRQFHRTIYRASENLDALTIVERSRGLIDCLRIKYGFGHARIPGMIREHRELVDALERKDVDETALLSSRHCERGKLDLLEQMRIARVKA